VVDGVESPPERDISDLEQAPDGRVAYMAMRPPTTSGGNPPQLIAGGLAIPWTTTFGIVERPGPAPAYHVAWSPDGKRFACIQRNHPNPGVTVLVNGKPMGPTYEAASQLAWSPDGTHLAYQGRSPSGTFLVLDGEESSGYNWIKEFQWSPDGKRYAYYGATSTAVSMIVDGKEQPKAMGVAAGTLRFSADSRHLVYGAQTNVAGYQPMVDGVLKPQNLGNFATRVQGNLPVSIPQFFFSPDGTHLAYVGQRTDGSGKTAVWVDGVAQQGPMPSYFHPAWSADGKHLAAVISNGSGQGWVIMIDGKFGPVFEDILVLNEASSRFVDGHTFRFYGIKAGQIYRVTLDLGD
jgi:WD40 repeat protein